MVGALEVVTEEVGRLHSMIRKSGNKGPSQALRRASEHECNGFTRASRKIEVARRGQMLSQLTKCEPVHRRHAKGKADTILIQTNFFPPRERHDVGSQHHRRKGLSRVEPEPTIR